MACSMGVSRCGKWRAVWVSQGVVSGVQSVWVSQGVVSGVQSMLTVFGRSNFS